MIIKINNKVVINKTCLYNVYMRITYQGLDDGIFQK